MDLLKLNFFIVILLIIYLSQDCFVYSNETALGKIEKKRKILTENCMHIAF